MCVQRALVICTRVGGENKMSEEKEETFVSPHDTAQLFWEGVCVSVCVGKRREGEQSSRRAPSICVSPTTNIARPIL